MINDTNAMEAPQFASLILRDILDYARFVRDSGCRTFKLSRGKLNFIKAKAESAEEFLDAIGAKNNQEWFPLRETVAILKNFSTSTYELVHLKYSSSFYDLGDKLEEYKAETQRHLDYMTSVIRISLLNLLDNAARLGLSLEPKCISYDFPEYEAIPHLEQNRHSSKSESAKKSVDAIAINFLNSTENVNEYRKLAESEVENWDRMDFDFLNESKARIMEGNMQNLQSLYDTYISNSEVEKNDKELLRKVRGRISICLHLTRISSIYIHFYERHLHGNPDAVPFGNGEGENCCRPLACLSGDEFKLGIIKYLSKYTCLFLNEGRKFCTQLLNKYCVIKTAEVKIPPYMGFHVRPSTLLAAIVLHYGGNVQMQINGTVYDASTPFNVSMANNYVDQAKRQYLSDRLHALELDGLAEQYKPADNEQRLALARTVILKLASMNVIRIYDMNTDENAMKFISKPHGSLVNFVYDMIVSMMLSRQIGIIYDAKVKFTGPEQAIDDIVALANANYCESETGEDLPLPKQLEYLNLRRKPLVRKAKEQTC